MAAEKVIALANAHVVQEAPNEAWAGGETFQINEDWNRDALVKFRLSPTVPLGTAIKSAKFFLYAERTTGGAPDQDRAPIVWSYGNNWAENTVTWNSRPPIGQQIGSMGLGVQRWKSIDVTTFVQGALGSDGIVSFYLGTAEHVHTWSGEIFFSRHKAGYEPYLLIETEAPPPPPPPTYTCQYCGATFSSQEELDDHIGTEHPPEPPPGTLRCPLCDQDLGVTGTSVEIIQEGPIFQQLRDEIAQKDVTIANLEAQIAAVQAEIQRIKEILGERLIPTI